MNHLDEPVSSSLSLGDQLYLQLKRDLMTGAFEPGDSLSIRRLAEEIGTSAMPVREALKRLSTERALVGTAKRSFKVPVLDRQRIANLFSLRSLLEGAAVEQAIPNMDRVTLIRLGMLVNAMDRHICQQDMLAYLRDNHEFHFLIYARALNGEMVSLIEQLWMQTGPSLRQGIREAPSRTDWNEVHEAITTAIRQGDVDTARALIRADIEWGVKLFRVSG